MSVTYFYYTGPLVDILTRVSDLNAKILIDLDLPVINYTSTVFNVLSGNVEVVFTSSLTDYQIKTLNNLCAIILYDGSVGNNVYTVDINSFNRRSFGISGTPTITFDNKSGYSPGSIITNTSNEVYMCTDSTTSNAVWRKLYPQTLGSQPYACISDLTSQFVLSILLSSVVTLNTNNLLNQITHNLLINPSRIIIQTNGVYLLTVNLQIGGAAGNVNLWIRKNGIDIGNTLSQNTLQNANDLQNVTITLIDSAVTNDYYEIVQSSTNIFAGLISLAAQINPIRPITPSVVLTINKISD